MNSPFVSVKLVIFTILDGKLVVFLPDNKLPHKHVIGISELDKIVEEITEKSLGSSTQTNYLEQLYTFSPTRKEGGITVSYFLLVQSSFVSSAARKLFIPINRIGSSHDAYIIEYALQRLRWKIEYTNVVFSLLPDEFTLGELQSTYEAILGKELDKRNFRKKILSLGIITASGKKRTGIQARPAQLYRFKTKKPVMVKVFS